MDVLKEIKKEHKEFRQMISKIEKGTKNKVEVFKELYKKIYAHHEAEEKVVFPGVKKSGDEAKKVTLEMIEEHNVITMQFKVIAKTTGQDETWDAKFSVLKEILEHHLDEEEKDFFEQAQSVYSTEELKKMYEPFEETMHKIEEEMEKKSAKKVTV